MYHGLIQLHLQPKQEQLYSLLTATGPTVATIIGDGGAKGGGKSQGADNCALLLAGELGNEYPGLKITIIRRVFQDLKENHIDKMLERYPELNQCYTDKDGIQLKNGAKIQFAYAETPGDVERKFRGGFESAFIFVDEAQQFTERELQDIQMACRWTKASTGLPPGFCKLILMFNPGGKSADYIRRIFWTRKYNENEFAHNYAFIHCFGWDNYEWFRGQVPIDEPDFYALESDQRFQLFITQTSEGRKYNAFPQAIRSGYLLGNFDHFEGQYFAGAWDSDKCVITQAMAEEIIQPWWPRWMAQDWGFGDHDSHGWYATGKLSPSTWMHYFGGHVEYPMDVVIRYREHLVQNRAEGDLGMDIVKSTPLPERKMIRRFFLSQDAFGQKAKQAGSHTVGQQFTDIMHRHGLPAPEPALQERVNGWRFMYTCLWQANLRGTNIDKERATQGPAFFVTTECPQAISCIPMALRDEDDPDDVMRVAMAVWEDVTDEIRYALASMLMPRGKAPKEVRARELYESITGDVPEDVMTSRAMAMRRFTHNEGVIKRAVRAPRWR